MDDDILILILSLSIKEQKIWLKIDLCERILITQGCFVEHQIVYLRGQKYRVRYLLQRFFWSEVRVCWSDLVGWLRSWGLWTFYQNIICAQQLLSVLQSWDRSCICCSGTALASRPPPRGLVTTWCGSATCYHALYITAGNITKVIGIQNAIRGWSKEVWLFASNFNVDSKKSLGL